MSKVKEVYFKQYYKRFQVQIVNTRFLLLDVVADKCLYHIIQIFYFFTCVKSVFSIPGQDDWIAHLEQKKNTWSFKFQHLNGDLIT